jgi:hypothetical protein
MLKWAHERNYMHLVLRIRFGAAFTAQATLSLAVEIHQESCGKIPPTAVPILRAQIGLWPMVDAR